MKKGITVILCTYNGANRLPATIKHLAAQTTSQRFDWELLVVDNASTDQSTQIAIEEWSKYKLGNIGFKVLYEPVAGKIYALEQAFSVAEFEYAIICDDDNWLNSDYLENMFSVFESNPGVGAVGGQGIPITDSGELPHWFKEFEDGYATGRQGKVTGDVTHERGYLWGAALGTRTKLYIESFQDLPSFLTGRLGNQLTAGEDSEYCQRLMLQGYTLYYDAKLIFRHYMPENRLTIQYRTSMFNGFTESDKILHKYRLANQLKDKVKGRILKKLALLVITPFRILFASTVQKKEKQIDILTLLSPLNINTGSITFKIKKLFKKTRS